MSEWPDVAVDYVQAVADTKLLLSHRYAERMLSGPVLEDDIASASAAQDEIGHVRQLFRLLIENSRENGWLEGDREPAEFCNAACLDDRADTWPEFVVRMGTTDRAAWYLIDAIDHEDFEGLAERIGQDEFFHLEHLDGRLESLAAQRPEEVTAAMEAAVPQVLAFLGPATGDDSDPLVNAGFSDRSTAGVRRGFRHYYEELLAGTEVRLTGIDWGAPDSTEWDPIRRRVGSGAVDPAVVDSLRGLKNAEFASE